MQLTKEKLDELLNEYMKKRAEILEEYLKQQRQEFEKKWIKE